MFRGFQRTDAERGSASVGQRLLIQNGIPALHRDMLRRLLHLFSRRRTLALPARVPEGLRVYVVADIHGRADLLDQLHELMNADFERSGAPDVHVIYLGDYIDRGPDSSGVLERLATRHAAFVKVTLLRGNHEELLLRFLRDSSIGSAWNKLGGLETLRSYGIDVTKVLTEEGYPGLSQHLAQRLPSHHKVLLEQLETCTSVGDYFFCHAGVRPGVPLDKQRPEDLSWIRTPFLDSAADFGKVVVHGHSPTDKPDFRHNRINIDTRAYATGRLTCLVLEDDTRRILST
jgi:serine/threonine protein phosphatase 1